jgi:hypothetical protein
LYCFTALPECRRSKGDHKDDEQPFHALKDTSASQAKYRENTLWLQR